jgi:copper chaperone CopZ
MHVGLRDVKVGSNQRDDQRVEDVVDELGEDLPSLAEIRK